MLCNEVSVIEKICSSKLHKHVIESQVMKVWVKLERVVSLKSL